MMDDELDDLFRDENLGQVATVPGLPVLHRGLFQSIDDSRATGCSQYVRLPIYLELPPESSPERSPGPIRGALPIFLAMHLPLLYIVSIAIPPTDCGP